MKYHQVDCQTQYIYIQYAMLSRFSRVQLCVTPQTAVHQALPSLGFSRQEHWSGLPFPESRQTGSGQTGDDKSKHRHFRNQ